MKAKLYSVSVIFFDPDVSRKINFSPWTIWWDREGLGNARDFNRTSKTSLSRLARVIFSRNDGRFDLTPCGWCYYPEWE